jgi:hypothetical protein
VPSSFRSIGDNRSTLPNAIASKAPLVEPLSPMALPRRASGGVFGSTAVFSHRPRCLQAPIDWGQSIYTAQRDSVTGYHGRAIVPNGSTATRQRRSLQFYGCFLQATKLSANASRRSIGDNRSTLPNVPAARAPMVEPLSPMALPRRVSGGVFGSTAVSPKQPNARLTPQKDRLGTIDLQCPTCQRHGLPW